MLSSKLVLYYPIKMHCFSLADFKISILSSLFNTLIIVFFGMDLFGLTYLRLAQLLGSEVLPFIIKHGKFSVIISSNIPSAPLSFSSTFGTVMTQMWDFLLSSLRSLEFFFYYFICFRMGEFYCSNLQVH